MTINDVGLEVPIVTIFLHISANAQKWCHRCCMKTQLIYHGTLTRYVYKIYITMMLV